MHELYDLRETLCKSLEEYGKRSDISAQALDVVDKLAHTIKNLDKIIESYDGESRNDGSYRGRSYWHGDVAHRGRRNVRRDTMGRYSGTEDMVAELKALMLESPDEQTRSEFQKFITRIESL